MPLITDLSTEVCPQCGKRQARGMCASCALTDLLSKSVEPEAPSVAPEEAAKLNIEFDRYLLKQRHASGGMGVIYVADDSKLKRTVALKVIRGSVFADEGELSRFTIEAEAAAALDHPNIVPIYEVGFVEDQPFFTMKLVRGENLAERLQRAQEEEITPRQIAEWISQIAYAVHHAHQRGVLHRDLKPGNILIDEDGIPWLTDFGLAKIVSRDGSLTRSGDSLGTPNYMPPELIMGATGGSTAGDVWALGIILWEALTGKLPFQGANQAEIMRRIVEEEPVPPKGRIDQDLLTLAQRCFEKAPERRLVSAAAVAEELERWLRGEPMNVRPISIMERVGRWTKRKPAWAALTLAVVIGSIASLSFWAKAESAVESLTTAVSNLNNAMAETAAAKMAMEARLKIEDEPDLALLLAAESAELTKRKGLGILPESTVALHETLRRIGGIDVSPFGSRPENRGTSYVNNSHTMEFAPMFSPNSRQVVGFHLGHPGVDLSAAVFDLDRLGSPMRWSLLSKGPSNHFEEWFADSQRLLSVSREGVVYVWSGLSSDGEAAIEQPGGQRLGNLQPSKSKAGVQVWLRAEGDTMRAFQLINASPAQNDGLVIEYAIDPKHAEPISVVREIILKLPEGAYKTSWKISPDWRWLIGNCNSTHWLVPVSNSADLSGGAVLSINAGNIVSFSPDGDWLALMEDTHHVALFNLRRRLAGEVVQSKQRVLSHETFLQCVAVSPEGTWVAACGSDNRVRVSFIGSAMTRELHVDADTVNGLQFSSDGRWLAAGTIKGTVEVWPTSDIEKGADGIRLLGLPTPTIAVTFSPDSHSVMGIGSGFMHGSGSWIAQG